MTHSDTFIHYGNYDVSTMIDILNDPFLNWDEFDFRQRTFSEHIKTKTIPVIFNSDFNSFEPEHTKNYHLFEKEFKMLESHLHNTINDEGYIMRAIFVKLLKNSFIPPHIDIVGKSLVLSKRLHIPIITNENCFFSVGDDIRNLKVGEIWEINNDKKMHGVSNNGNEDRIHLIVDWISKNDI